MGHHKFSYCGPLYGDIHRFLATMEWRPIEHESNTSGVTWLELFILFDTTNARNEQGKHIKDRDAKKRADARTKKRRSEGGAKGRSHGQAIVEPSLDEELKRSKAIVRNITRHELNQTQTNWFGMERRAKLRRLGGLDVI